uniref:Uncharacterized protein n=1 Tax=Nothoprocta perdicaria TaxID=30464 RepID=A0A8C6Z2D0_NOTPE
VGEAEVQNLVAVLLQSLHFHAGDGVVEPLELVVPGNARARTWVPRHLAGHAVVAVEKLPPEEVVAGHGAPLAAHERGGQHVRVLQVQEDLVEDAVREQGAAAALHRGILPRRPHGTRLRLRHLCQLRSPGMNPEAPSSSSCKDNLSCHPTALCHPSALCPLAPAAANDIPINTLQRVIASDVSPLTLSQVSCHREASTAFTWG